MEKSISTISLVISIFITIIHLVPHVSSHGRMMEPPARNTMWRFGFPTKANYEDSELFCGGIKVNVVELNSSELDRLITTLSTGSMGGQ